MKKNLSTLIVAMIPAGIALNWVANSIVELLKLPLFLNNIGTVLNAIVLGPWWGMTTAALTNVILALVVRWTYLPFMLVGMLIALVAHYFFRWGWYQKLWKVFVSGAVSGVLGACLATLISVYVFGGFSGHMNDTITAGLIAAGQQIVSAAFIANLPTTMADKVITFWVVWMILRIFPVRYLPNAKTIRERIGMKAA